MLFREHPENKGAIFVREKGGRNHDVFAWRKFEAVAHLASVDEGAAHGHRPLPQQDVWAKTNTAAAFVLTGG